MVDFKIKKGHNIPLAGKPKKIVVKFSEPASIIIHPHKIKGIKPKLLIKEGDFIKTGAPLFIDKNFPDVQFTSPSTGYIKSIKFGPRRIIEKISIENNYGEENFSEFNVYSDNDILKIEKTTLINELTTSGAWTYIRQRPYSKIANPMDSPKSIFVSGFNTAPHAPDIDFLIEQNSTGLQAGINAMTKLTEGNINLSISNHNMNDNLHSLNNVELHTFSGPHPAGNIGIQVHHIDPIKIGELIWYIDIQDLMSIGNQLLTGKPQVYKYITVSGEKVKSPSYLKVRRNTSLDSVLNDKLDSGDCRIISGDILTGEKTKKSNGLGYYDSQITVIPEGGDREFLGWIKPGFNKYSLSNTFLSKFKLRSEWSLNTSKNGSPRAIIPFGYWENVLPMDILPQYLVKSILARDIEEMEQLGIYECDPEDFALCSFVCQSKFPVHRVINDGLDFIEMEG